MLPSIFGESLFDDWMGFPFRGFESDVDRKLYGRHAAHVMKTDLKEHDEGYELKVDLPGFKKDQIDLQLQNGYLTITASKCLEEEGKDKKEIEDEKQMLVAMMKDKATKKFEKQDGIKSYEALSEEISEDGKTAIVKMKIVMGDGSETTDDIKLRKDEDGNWKLDIGK